MVEIICEHCKNKHNIPVIVLLKLFIFWLIVAVLVIVVACMAYSAFINYPLYDLEKRCAEKYTHNDWTYFNLTDLDISKIFGSKWRVNIGMDR